MTTTAKATVRVRRLFNAPPASVFDAWTDAATMRQWFFPGPVEIAEIEMEPVVGGRFRIVMADADGRFEHVGAFVEVERPHRLVFTWASNVTRGEDTLVTIELTEKGPRTELTLTHEQLPDREAATRHEGGWSNILDALARHLAL